MHLIAVVRNYLTAIFEQQNIIGKLMKKLLSLWFFVWFLFTITTQAEERTQTQIQITRLPQLMDCGSVTTIGQRIAALGQTPFLQSQASIQVPQTNKIDPNIIFGEVMIFFNKDTTTYSMVFKLPDAMRQKGNIDLCIFGVGNKLRPAMTLPQVETAF